MENKLDYQKIGINIKEIRKHKKLTQQQLADKIYKTESSIRKYEKGLVEIPDGVMFQISAALGVSVSELTDSMYEYSVNDAISRKNTLDMINKDSLQGEDLAYLEREREKLDDIIKPQYQEIDEFQKQICEQLIGYINASLEYLNTNGLGMVQGYIERLTKDPMLRK